MIELWTLRWAGAAPAGLLARCRAVLSDAEAAKVVRFRTAERRAQAVLSRGLLRYALGRRLAHAPRGLQFATAPRGRPRLDAAFQPQGLGVDFNLSHAQGCVACAVSGGPRVGVDVEDRARVEDVRRVASQFLSPRERPLLENCSPTVRDGLLVRLWTAKEALAKGVGAGLALHLPGLCFAASLEDAAQSGAAVWERPLACKAAPKWRVLAPTNADLLGSASVCSVAVRDAGRVMPVIHRDAAELIFGAPAQDHIG